MTFAEVEPLSTPEAGIVGIPEDVAYIRDPLDRIVALLGQLIEATVGGANPAAQRLPFPFTQTVRFRAEWLILKLDVAGVISLRVGPGVTDTFPFAGADTKVIPFPFMIDRGIDVSLTATAGSPTGFLVGYPDES